MHSIGRQKVRRALGVRKAVLRRWRQALILANLFEATCQRIKPLYWYVSMSFNRLCKRFNSVEPKLPSSEKREITAKNLLKGDMSDLPNLFDVDEKKIGFKKSREEEPK